MTGLRHLLQHRRGLAAWLVAAALLMKLLVPAGFMPMVADGRITLEVCSGLAAEPMAVMDMRGDMPAMHGDSHAPRNDHKTVEMPCAFAGLAAPALAAADAVLLAAAIAFMVSAVFRESTRRLPRRPAHLRPPLRGPPIRS